MTSGASFGRFVGTGLTWASLIALALWGLWAFARTAIV
jgi:hypothetical protein